MTQKRGLGRTLNALLAGSQEKNEIRESDTLKSELQYLPVEYLQRGQYQPRLDMDTEALEELAESIKAQGIIQPIVVRPVSEHLFEIIAGERRWRAAQLAGLEKVPVLVKDIPDEAAIAMALIENIQRENLNPLEEANALKRLMDEFKLTHEEVASAVGKSRTTVTNFLRLLNLNSDVKLLLEHGDISMGHARALLSLTPETQSEAAHQIALKDLSVRETENLVRRIQNPSVKTIEKSSDTDPNIRKLQEEISEKLGAKVVLKQEGKGQGKLLIHYHSLDELEGILSHIH